MRSCTSPMNWHGSATRRFRLHATRLEEEVHEERLAAADVAPDVEPAQRRGLPRRAPKRPSALVVFFAVARRASAAASPSSASARARCSASGDKRACARHRLIAPPHRCRHRRRSFDRGDEDAVAAVRRKSAAPVSARDGDGAAAFRLSAELGLRLPDRAAPPSCRRRSEAAPGSPPCSRRRSSAARASGAAARRGAIAAGPGRERHEELAGIAGGVDRPSAEKIGAADLPSLPAVIGGAAARPRSAASDRARRGRRAPVCRRACRMAAGGGSGVAGHRAGRRRGERLRRAASRLIAPERTSGCNRPPERPLPQLSTSA